LRILTANLLNGRADPTALAEILEQERIDVAAVQELGSRQVPAIESVLPCGKLEARDDHCGMGIALRHPAEVTRLPLRDRDARVARLGTGDWPGLPGLVEVLNVHLQAPHARPFKSFSIRRDQVAGIERYLEGQGPARRILVGDLNATPVWPAYRRLAARLPDLVAGHAEERGHTARRTWGPWPGAPRLLRIDHALGAAVRAAHVERIEIPGSDHSAVLLEIDFGEPSAG